ncbi:hypothetical protein FCM35_KLT00391 [Carex littledalei]|uniref:CCHC-type domain-containing protein n=1 Tax=Carex littledalei TaxID=544730 RepID=A0A833RW94_9POAL|nr:hypothetical protein FCM35_KLT00391 [Carex littledalei]
MPYLTKPTYAQAVASNPSTGRPLTTQPTSQTGRSSPTSPPTSPKSPTYYLSPHSPTPLRFPPSPKFGEWKGRCFRCCRMGHTKAVCRNPPKCGRCWRNGHTGNRCKVAHTKQSPAPTVEPTGMRLPEKTEPGFRDLLMANRPLNPPPMPPNRQADLKVYVDRDQEYYQEVQRLQQAVVVHTEGLAINFELSVDKVAEWVTQTKVIDAKEVSIAVISQRRFLIIMPEGVAPETLIEAIPYDIWDLGLSFQLWDPTEDAITKLVPQFRVIVDIHGIPPPLYREKEAINLVNSFGLYLGSIAQRKPEDISCWTVVAATAKLEDIPRGSTMIVGGWEYPVQFKPVNWMRGPIYTENDFPAPPPKFTKPPKLQLKQRPDPPRAYRGNDDCEEEDRVYMSRKVLRELFRDVNPENIPEELREIIVGQRPDQPWPAGGANGQDAAQGATWQEGTDDQQHGLDLQPIQSRLKSIICVPQRIRDRSPMGQVQAVPSSHENQMGENVEIEVELPNREAEARGGRDMGLDETGGLGISCGDSQAPNQPTVTRMATLQITTTQETVTIDRTPTPRQLEGMNDLFKEKDTQPFSPKTLRSAPLQQQGEHLMSTTPVRLLTRKEVQLAETLQSVRDTVKLKRKFKNTRMERDGPGGPSNISDGPKTKVQLGEDGLYQVQITYSHSLDLATATGVSQELMGRLIEEDNIARAVQENADPKLHHSDQQSSEEDDSQDINWGDHSSPDTDGDSGTDEEEV